MKRIKIFNNVVNKNFKDIQKQVCNKLDEYNKKTEELKNTYHKSNIKEEELIIDNKDDINLDNMLNNI